MMKKANILKATPAFQAAASVPTKMMVAVVIFLSGFLSEVVREQVKESKFSGTQALQVAKRALYYSGIEADASKYGVGRYSSTEQDEAQSEARTEWYDFVEALDWKGILDVVEAMFPSFAAVLSTI
jgi:hypothetical protein